MTKFAFLSRIFNMPEHLLLSPPSAETEHEEFVRELNEKHQHPSYLIEAGLNPFKAWREDFGETQMEMAEILDVDLHYYIDIEKGEIDYTKDDVLNFCRYFRLQPYDMVSLKTPYMPSAIRDALLDVFHNPNILPTDDEGRGYKIEWMLIDEASPTLSIGRLSDIRNRFSELSYASLTVNFIDKLLSLDGSYRMGFIDDANAVLAEVIDDVKLTKKPNAALIVEAKRKKDKLWNDYNHIGNRLYRDDWKEAHQRLMLSKQIIKKPSLFFKTYAKSPSVLGMSYWPTHTGNIVFEGRHLDWRQAQKIHASLLNRYFDAVTEVNDLMLQFKNSTNTVTHLEGWASHNKGLLARYNNRQVLMHDSKFSQVRPRDYGFDMQTFEKPVVLKPIQGLRTQSVELSFEMPGLDRLFCPKIA